MMEDRYAIVVKDPKAKCNRSCMGVYEGEDSDGYMILRLPEPMPTDCARHVHVLITPENEGKLIHGFPTGLAR